MICIDSLFKFSTSLRSCIRVQICMLVRKSLTVSVLAFILYKRFAIYNLYRNLYCRKYNDLCDKQTVHIVYFSILRHRPPPPPDPLALVKVHLHVAIHL